MRIIFSFASKLGWELEQLDVQTAFLCADIDTDLYMHPPEGFKIISTNPDRKRSHLLKQPILKLHKAIYGIKQAPRLWNRRLTNYLKSIGFVRCEYDHSLWMRDTVLILVYVDDLLVAGPSETERAKVKKQLFDESAMTDGGPVTFFLGMHVHRRKKPDGSTGFGLSQVSYIDQILEEFNMTEARLVLTPMVPGCVCVKREHESRYAPAVPRIQDPPSELGNAADKHLFAKLVGSLNHINQGTRPDIGFALNHLAQFASVHPLPTGKPSRESCATLAVPRITSSGSMEQHKT